MRNHKRIIYWKRRIGIMFLTLLCVFPSLPVGATEVSKGIVEMPVIESTEFEQAVVTEETFNEKEKIEVGESTSEVMEETTEMGSEVGYDSVENQETQVATTDNMVTFVGNFSSAADETIYQTAVDFSTMDSVAFCLVRTGYIGVNMSVFDENGIRIASTGTSDIQPKNWCFLDKPDDQVHTYKIVVSPSKYTNKLSDYRIVIGNKKDAEKMMSGKDNAVLVDLYFEKDKNRQISMYTPNQYEYWFKYKYGYKNTITILSYSYNLRFKIVDPEDMETVYDSNAGDNYKKSHRQKACGIWTSVEKASDPEGTTPGKEYYLVVYNICPTTNTELAKRTFSVAVGNPVMAYGRVSVYPSKTIYMSKKRYTRMQCKVDDSQIPETAQAKSISVSGVGIMNLGGWDALSPDHIRSGIDPTARGRIDMNFDEDSSFNAQVKGTWTFNFIASSTARSMEFRPDFDIAYYYEYGD